MRNSIINFETRSRERVFSTAEQARIHARSGREAAQIEQIVEAVRVDALPVGEAHAALAQLRRDQQRAAA